MRKFPEVVEELPWTSRGASLKLGGNFSGLRRNYHGIQEELPWSLRGAFWNSEGTSKSSERTPLKPRRNFSDVQGKLPWCSGCNSMKFKGTFLKFRRNFSEVQGELPICSGRIASVQEELSWNLAGTFLKFSEFFDHIHRIEIYDFLEICCLALFSEQLFWSSKGICLMHIHISLIIIILLLSYAMISSCKFW